MGHQQRVGVAQGQQFHRARRRHLQARGRQRRQGRGGQRHVPGCTKAVTRAPVQARQLGKAARRGRSQPGLALAQRIGQRRVGREQAQGRQQDADLRHQAPSLDQSTSGHGFAPRASSAWNGTSADPSRAAPASRNQLLCTATRAGLPCCGQVQPVGEIAFGGEPHAGIALGDQRLRLLQRQIRHAGGDHFGPAVFTLTRVTRGNTVT